MYAIIPCAGYATRLYPLTLNKPKALLTINNKTILDYVLEKLITAGIYDITIISNAKYFFEFKSWTTLKNVKVINDNTTSNKDRLGQVGDIMLGIKDDDVIIIAGDNLFDFEIESAITFAKDNNCIVNVVYDVHSITQAKKLGIVTLDRTNKIIQFDEKPENPKSTLASLGIYIIPKDKVILLKNYIEEKNNLDKMGYCMQWLITMTDVYGVRVKGKWFDIGSIESLMEARKIW